MAQRGAAEVGSLRWTAAQAERRVRRVRVRRGIPAF
jgi:hypothetical protein